MNAVIAATAALSGLLLAHYLRERSEKRADCREQLRKLYGPIWVLTQHTKGLIRQIGGKEPDWSLLDNVEAVMEDERTARIASEILESNGKIVKAIVEGAGLALDATVPKCFLDFLVHAAVVRAAVETKKSPLEEDRFGYPNELDGKVADAVDKLQLDIGLKGRRSLLDLMRR